SSRIDDGWLDMLEDPKPTKTQTTRRDETANDQSPVPAPLLHGNQKYDENPSHTLEMFPDALLDLEAPGKTITHGFESLSQDLSEAEQAPVNAATPASTPTAATVSQHNTDDSQARPAHTLELFVLDAHLQDHDSGKVTDPNKTLSGGFE